MDVSLLMGRTLVVSEIWLTLSRYVFLIFGSISIVAGVIALLFLPDAPSTAKFLTEHERWVAVERVAANRGGIKNARFKKYQMEQFLRDPKSWILFVYAVSAQIPNSALTSVSHLNVDPVARS